MRRNNNSGGKTDHGNDLVNKKRQYRIIAESVKTFLLELDDFFLTKKYSKFRLFQVVYPERNNKIEFKAFRKSNQYLSINASFTENEAKVFKNNVAMLSDKVELTMETGVQKFNIVVSLLNCFRRVKTIQFNRRVYRVRDHIILKQDNFTQFCVKSYAFKNLTSMTMSDFKFDDLKAKKFFFKSLVHLPKLQLFRRKEEYATQISGIVNLKFQNSLGPLSLKSNNILNHHCVIAPKTVSELDLKYCLKFETLPQFIYFLKALKNESTLLHLKNQRHPNFRDNILEKVKYVEEYLSTVHSFIF